MEKSTEVRVVDQNDVMRVEEVNSQLVNFQMEDIDKKLADVEKVFELIGKLRKFSLKHLSPSCVTNENGRPYIMESGVGPFNGPFGIYEKDVEGFIINRDSGRQISMEDPDAFKGQFQAIIYRGIIGSKMLNVELSFEGGVFMDEKNEKFHNKEDFLWYVKKAKANWRGRGIKKLLGLDNINWDELASYGISPANCATVERKQGTATKKDANTVQDENEKRGEIATILAEHCKDAESRSNQLEEFTKFTGKDGKEVSGVRDPKNLSGTRLNIALKKIKEWDEEIKKNWSE